MEKLMFQGAHVAQIRIARPTDQLERVVAFYRDGLGLRELGRFEGHAGYDGVLLGLPGSDYHLELTSHADGSPGPAPTTDNLLVLYLDSREAAEALAARLASRGHPVELRLELLQVAIPPRTAGQHP